MLPCVVPGGEKRGERREERGEIRRQMVENIIDISVLKAEIPGNTLALSLSSDLYKPTPPASHLEQKSKYIFTLYFPRERRCENCKRGHSEAPSHGLV